MIHQTSNIDFNSNDLISVIIPMYNAENYIEETIKSVMTQSYNNLEIIIVNDGSIDNSAIICRKYITIDKRVFLIEQKNSGVSIARNEGLKIAKGKYIFFMDSDDTIDCEFIKSSHEAAIKHEADIVVIGEYYCKRMKTIVALPTCAQFIKSDFLKKSGVLFPENIQPCEDGLFSHQLLCLTDKIGFNELGIYNYRSHENQNHKIINNNSNKVLKQIPIWFEILERFYSSKNVYHSHALNLALFIEHEPFELRFMSMNFDAPQKKELHALIVQFINKNVNPFLKKSEKNRLSKAFLIFIKSKDGVIFEKKLNEYYKKQFILKKILFFLINFIPISNYRKLYRKKVINHYEDTFNPA